MLPATCTASFYRCIISWVCYAKTPRNRCGGVLADAMDRVTRRYYRPVDDVDLFEARCRAWSNGSTTTTPDTSPSRKRPASSKTLTRKSWASASARRSIPAASSSSCSVRWPAVPPS